MIDKRIFHDNRKTEKILFDEDSKMIQNLLKLQQKKTRAIEMIRTEIRSVFSKRQFSFERNGNDV